MLLLCVSTLLPLAVVCVPVLSAVSFFGRALECVYLNFWRSGAVCAFLLWLGGAVCLPVRRTRCDCVAARGSV